MSQEEIDLWATELVEVLNDVEEKKEVDEGRREGIESRLHDQDFGTWLWWT
jgi:hypothetical protein